MRATAAPRGLFNEILGLINAGELGAAEARCREALQRHPGDVNMQALLGALLVKLDRRAEAEATLRTVLDAAPSFAKPAEDLGYLLVATGRAAEALPLCRWRDDDPVQIERPLRQRRSAPSRITEHFAVPFRKEERIAALRSMPEARFEQLERDSSFAGVEHARGRDDPPHRLHVGGHRP